MNIALKRKKVQKPLWARWENMNIQHVSTSKKVWYLVISTQCNQCAFSVPDTDLCHLVWVSVAPLQRFPSWRGGREASCGEAWERSRACCLLDCRGRQRDGLNPGCQLRVSFMIFGCSLSSGDSPLFSVIIQLLIDEGLSGEAELLQQTNTSELWLLIRFTYYRVKSKAVLTSDR